MSKNEPYTVFTGVGCKWCEKAINVLERLRFDYVVVPIKGNKQALTLLSQKGLNTVPQIFVNEELIGGYEDLIRHLYGEDETVD